MKPTNDDLRNDDLRNDELKHALRRRAAPDGFSERLMLRLEQQSGQKSRAVPRESLLTPFTRPLVRWAAAGALAVVLVAGGIHIQNVRRERAEGEAAKQRLMLALRIAGSKLQLARSKVNRGNASQNANQVHDQTEN
jgi:hypothetical protein